MPKRKLKKIKRRNIRNKPGILYGFFIGTLAGLVILFVGGSVSFFAHSKNNSSKIPILAPSPTNTPIPTASITLSPIVSKGQNIQTNINNNGSTFCLNVPVLMYHHVEPYSLAQKEGHASLTVDNTYFEKHLEYLKNSGFTTISSDQLVQALIQKSSLPPKSIMITLDDGYIDAYTYAYPLAKKYNMILNLMIPTGLLENGDYLSWGQLKEMVNSGLVFAYDHTWSHASLGNASPDKINQEIMTAKTQLEDHLGKKVNIFTYPYGSQGDIVINFLQSHGFTGAFSTIPGFTQCNSFIMSLHRNRIGNAPLSSFGL